VRVTASDIGNERVQLRNLLRSLEHSDKNGNKLVTFFSESWDLFGWDDFSIDEQFKPMGGLIRCLPISSPAAA
jgi:hypothetical protein